MSLKITVDLGYMKNYLRVEHSLDDDLIEDLFNTASNEAESFLNTDFHEYDESGNLIENEAPSEVKFWVLNRMAEMYENRGMISQPDYSSIQHLRVYPFKDVIGETTS
jgi:hypothetical protein